LQIEKPVLRIYEIDYSVSPGGNTEYEVYSMHEEDLFDPPIFAAESLHAAVDFCYDLGVNFEVRTLAQYERENENELVVN
jgi:hypothetical protein